MSVTIKKERVVGLLGRPLSEPEDKQYTVYLKIAQSRLEDLLCVTLEGNLAPEVELLLARCFATIAQEQAETANGGIRSKKIEDFSVTYDEDALSPMAAFVKQNEVALEKYSKCQAAIRHGKVTNGNGIRPIFLR